MVAVESVLEMKALKVFATFVRKLAKAREIYTIYYIILYYKADKFVSLNALISGTTGSN